MPRLPESISAQFQPGRRLESWAPLYELGEELLYSPGRVTRGAPHIRDAFDLKRLNLLLAVALLPCILVAIHNTGQQASLAVAAGAAPLLDWRATLFSQLGGHYHDAGVLDWWLFGAIRFFPVAAVCCLSMLATETVFAVARRRRLREDFLVAGMLLALTLPPITPLWQAGLGAAFGVLFGKEVFGGLGMTFLNPVIIGRAFLFFAYPVEMSGDAPWVAAQLVRVDGFTGATPLTTAALDSEWLARFDWWSAFLGAIPGSMGETSALACAIGGAFLIYTRIVSWRIVAGVTLGTLVAATALNAIGSESNPMFDMPFHWHVVTGGWAFGTVFLATDPASSPFTNSGRWVHGLIIGMLAIAIRVLNPGYPEGTMLAILFASLFAPLINAVAIRTYIRRRRARHAL
jgi:Na+-transporting NADH:ubiquinone oxidoreductase subunit B